MLNSSILAALLLLGAPSPIPYESYQTVGTANYWLGPFKLYRATLMATHTPFDTSAPFALKLEYTRSIPASKIANASIVEMARLSNQAEDTYEYLREDLEACFGDVSKGDEIIGFKRNENTTEFSRNGALRCTIDEPNFSTHFFAIWLSPDSRSPNKTKDLIGQ